MSTDLSLRLSPRSFRGAVRSPAAALLALTLLVLPAAAQEDLPPLPGGGVKPASADIPVGATPDISIAITEATIGRFANAMMPLTLRGTRNITIGVPVVGAIDIQIPWVVVVTNPRVSLQEGRALFDADVDLQAGPLRSRERISGALVASFDLENRQIVMSAQEAFLTLRSQQGPGAEARLDVAERMPPFRIPVSLPKPVIQLGEKSIRVTTDPQVQFAEKMLLVTTDLLLTPADGAADLPVFGGGLDALDAPDEPFIPRIPRPAPKLRR